MGRDDQRRRPAVTTEERDAFLAAVSGTVPLEGGDRDRVRVVAPEPAPQARRVEVLPAPVALSVEGDGVVISARAPGVNRAQLAELRGGRIRPEATLDLHGHTVREAEGLLRRFLLDASTQRRRCVLVVHGRGLHSDGVALVRDAVITALVGDMSGLVHAFATAARSDGGAGATYVMVKA
jgi:DNA-nicking Smr family endonuclease